MSRWKKKDSRTVARSTFFTLVEDDVVLPDGTEKTYTMLELPDFAGVLPRVEDRLILVKNYRYPIDRMVIELPAGFIEPDESPEEAAGRELKEETGYELKWCDKINEYHPIASLNDQKAHLYVGEAEKCGGVDHDEGEDIEVFSLNIEKAYELLEKGELSHPHTMIALHSARERLTDLS
ncbi:MAG: NUDIX hydrolase [Candidatus Thermoplasmatota archaeon]